jgi:nucleoside phosphorylase
MSDPARYTVGWICALPVEYVAAQEFLDEEHEKPSFVSPNDNNDYTLGKIHEHNVVIAVLPDGEYGTASAANIATNMLNTFHNVRIGLMVGIGGGVPSKKHDVRLGDVVVSTPRAGEGGVFQYDFGKSIQGQEFQHTRFLNQPPTILRTAITGIQAQYKREVYRLGETINSILEKNRRLRRIYERPAPITDRLFQPAVIHKSDCGAASYINTNLVIRPKRSEDDDNPAIHYSLIASANQLMKNTLTQDRLAAEKDVLYFEIEAAGLVNTFPYLVIRGIYNYSDSHKNKEWQGYTAIVAAAYAKDLLQRIPPSRIEAKERISVILSSLSRQSYHHHRNT